MKIVIVTPAASGSHHGNRHTAARWATLLRGLGHHVRVALAWDGTPADLMIALHARRSHDPASRFAADHPDRPLILVLTGTDLYRDIRRDASAQDSMRLATRLVVLQEQGCAELASDLRRKCRVIYQSAPTATPPPALKRCFEVVVSGHLREEKDPFRAAMAAARLPPESRIRITHIGAAMSAEMERAARSWAAREPRYTWLGGVSHGKALRLLARSRLMVISSRMEGGANVVSEAIAAGVPVIASRIPGNIGMLGRRYAGYYPVEDERALARLLWRVESEPEFYRTLRSQCRSRRALVTPRSERNALKILLSEFS
ncbi:MAG: glycosyl transferase family 1 [Betaproteobacteria bacterium RIFCSPLOWO2_02_FULL_67_26]|nr:MAG: glycosyl transferase family 1 [Betaproteobacteria bacterium RIFCSPLOWO2_02_FULL_67_26]